MDLLDFAQPSAAQPYASAPAASGNDLLASRISSRDVDLDWAQDLVGSAPAAPARGGDLLDLAGFDESPPKDFS